MSYVIALDPGEITGWARLLNGQHAYGEMPCYDALYWVDQTLEQGARPVLICEDFIYTQETAKKSRQTWSTESIGVVKFWQKKYGIVVHIYPASDKAFGSDNKLKLLGWYHPSKDGHQNDASRHLLRYAAENGLISLRDVLQ